MNDGNIILSTKEEDDNDYYDGEEKISQTQTQTQGVIMTVNDNNKYTVSELEYMRHLIEGMEKFNQIAILKIVHSTSPDGINENNYGCKINLTELSNDTIEEINNHIKHVTKQEHLLKINENKKDHYINDFFAK